MLPGPRVLSALALACASCTLIFNTDELPDPLPIDAPTIDAPTDARDEDAPVDAPIDSDPSMLTLGTANPPSLDEGMGTGVGGRMVVLLVEATDLVDEAMVTVDWAPPNEGAPLMVGTPVVSGAHGRIAIPLAIPATAAFAPGTTRMLRISVTAASVTATKDVPVHGHAELSLTGAVNADDAQFDDDYATITTTGDVAATGTTPLRLVAFGTIQINHVIDASATGAAPGPGGCARGGIGVAGACPPGGGGVAGPGADGGGGGFGANGVQGSDPMTGGNPGGGPGGMVVGNAMLVPILIVSGAGNRGNGGGGGSASLLDLGGGAGGHGAGVVYVSGGVVAVGTNGRIFANGAVGTAGGLGGSGGGGSGGAIFVRSGTPIGRASAWLNADGAAGGNNGGGRGGEGRIRIDDPSGALPTTVPAPALGPSWPIDVPLVVRASVLMLTARAANGCYAVSPAALLTPGPADSCSGGDGAGPDRTLTPAGREIGFALRPGLNHLCIRWTRTSMLGTTTDLPEAASCVDVVYIEP